MVESSRHDRPEGLNPTLETRRDTTHDTSESSRPPVETASVQRDEGRFWPMVWAAACLLGALIVLWLLFG